MEKHAKPGGLRALGRYPVLILFTAFFAGVFLLDGITPDRRISELENTTLTQRPAVTAQILTARGLNDFFNSYSQYTKDQIPGRDAWIGLQSFVETTLLQRPRAAGCCWGPADRCSTVPTALSPARSAPCPGISRRWPPWRAAIPARCTPW